MNDAWSEHWLEDTLCLVPTETMRSDFAEVRRQPRFNERKQRQRLLADLDRWKRGQLMVFQEIH